MRDWMPAILASFEENKDTGTTVEAVMQILSHLVQKQEFGKAV